MSLSDSLNQSCACKTLDAGQLRRELERSPGLSGLGAGLLDSHPHLFAETAVFIDAATADTLARAVAAIERVAALPGYQAQALTHATPLAQHAFGPSGVFMGYDFHLGAEGPRLIEINTNAGGGLLNAALARAHRSCCAAMDEALQLGPQAPDLDATFAAMFRAEWRSQRADATWRTVLIVDDAPQAQYLAPEFAMARAWFRAQGLLAEVADPAELLWRDGALWHAALPADQPVDLVYNRLTDFDLSEPGHAALRQAYEAGAVVLTPHPRAHALLAHKHNLIALSNPDRLAEWGASEADRALLQEVVPPTETVTPDKAEALWARRRQLFFKPGSGYGGKAAYRGDKLTRRVWDEIVTNGSYVAQALVPPSERLVTVDGAEKHLKLDLRAYTYQGQIQLLAARLYAGQTTNFRTPSGGFSPVAVLPA
jgi:hypothetical protein